MKPIWTSLLAVCAVVGLSGCQGLSLDLPFATTSSTYQNPVLYADYSDPDVIRVGEDYYMVASSFHFSPGIPILTSKDLVHWKIVGHVLADLPFHSAYNMTGPTGLTDATSKPVGEGMRHAGGVWAPSIRHHKGLIYVYWATPDEGIFMATAKDPRGPWSKPVTVMAQPKLEDPCPFWDDDGQAYLIHGKVGAGPLVLHKMSEDGTRVLDDGVVIAEDKVNLPVLEGPKFYKRDGYYYIFAPIGGVEKGPQAVGRAKNIYGPYEWRSVLVPSDTVLGPHQGGYVETETGQGWFLHFNSTGAFGRINHLQPVVWKDGWPVMGDAEDGAQAGKPVAEFAAPDTAAKSPNYRLQDSDDFSGPKLGLQWSFSHNPDNRHWRLKGGHLRLEATQSEFMVTARNTITQILQGPEAIFTTKMSVTDMVDNQRAGLVLFGVKPVWIGAVKDEGKTYVTFSSAGVETRGPEITGKTITLRAHVTADQKVATFYSLDNRHFVPLGDVTPLARFSWWKGSRPGLFTYIKGQSGDPAADNHVDFDYFKVEHKRHDQ